MNKKKRVVTGLALGAVLALGFNAAAFAEGSFTSTLDQVQPGFDSRLWNDKGNDSNSTIVTLTSCKGNLGGASPTAGFVKSVALSLYVNGTLSKTVTEPCGTYDFGKRGGSTNDYYFEVTSINGSTSKQFLNANVKVAY